MRTPTFEQVQLLLVGRGERRGPQSLFPRSTGPGKGPTAPHCEGRTRLGPPGSESSAASARRSPPLCRGRCWDPLPPVSGWLPAPCPTRGRPHLYAGCPQEDHDLIDEAQQGHEHGVPVVKPLAEEEREEDVGGSPAEQRQREGPAWGRRRASGLRGPAKGVPQPPLTSVAVQLPRQAPQLLQDLVGHRRPPDAQAVQDAHGELAGGPPARPRREEDACGPDARRDAGGSGGLTPVPKAVPPELVLAGPVPSGVPWSCVHPPCHMDTPTLPQDHTGHAPACCPTQGPFFSAAVPGGPQKQSWPLPRPEPHTYRRLPG